MSYARWSNSAWYAFYNVNGKLSLWYSTEKTIDWEYDELVWMMEHPVEKVAAALIEVYKCTELEAAEAVQYIESFIKDYDPKDGEEYDSEVKAMLAKWEAMENGNNNE
jgi:hypothetical protein